MEEEKQKPKISLHAKAKVLMLYRKMYNVMCGRCKKIMVQHTLQHGRNSKVNPSKVAKECEDLLCEGCKKKVSDIMKQIIENLKGEVRR